MITSNIISRFPAGSGSYGLVLYLPRKTVVAVGKLGSITFPRGYYLYLGSAFGPGGLRARLKRHMKRSKRLHWHIDYLRKAADIRAIWMVDYGGNLEHVWAQRLLAPDKETISIKRFGCSDCRCASHLFYFQKRPDAQVLVRPGIKIKMVRIRPGSGEKLT